MPVKHIISSGVGFSPGHVKYIVTRGLTPSAITGVVSLTLNDRVVALTLDGRAVTLTLNSRSLTLTLISRPEGIMTPDDRKLKESPLRQGEDEQLAYTLTTTPWGSSPSSPAVVVKDDKGNDVTTDVTSGSASVASDVITTPTIQSLTKDKRYRLEVKFTISGNVFEAWGDLYGEE